MKQDEVRGLLLAGGRSRRMGRDKRLLQIGEEPLVAHAFRVLIENFGPPWVLVASQQDVEELRPILGPSAHFLIDQAPGEGPLPAIVDALAQLDRQHAFLLATDIPGLSSEALRAFNELHRAKSASASSEIDALVPMAEGKAQVTCAFYRKSLESPLRAAREEGIRCLVKGLRQSSSSISYLSEAEVESLGGEKVFANLNTPEDLQHFQQKQTHAS